MPVLGHAFVGLAIGMSTLAPPSRRLLLAEVRAGVVAVLGAADVPDVPARGEFEIEDVLRAEFFFS